MGLFDNISSAWDNLTWQSSAQKTTGAVGGSTNAQSPGFNISGIISDWTSSISTAWDSLFKQTPTSQAQSNYYNTPYVAPQVTPQQLQTTNWGGVSSTPAVPNVALPSPSIQYTPQVTKPAWEDAGLNAQPFFAPQPAYAQDTNQPQTSSAYNTMGDQGLPHMAQPFNAPAGFGKPDTVIQDIAKQYLTTGTISDLYDPFLEEQGNKEKVATAVTDSGNDKQAVDLVTKYIKAGEKPPDISEERLNKVSDEGTMSTLYNYGYKFPILTDAVKSNIQSVNVSHNGRVTFDETQLNGLNYNSLKNAILELQSFNSQDWLEFEDKDVTLQMMVHRAGTNAMGEPVYQFDGWKEVPKYKTTAQKETEAKAKSQTAKAEAEAEATAKYWSPEEVADRNRSRQENADWSEARQMEGWSGFYKVFDLLQLSPNMDEYFNSPDMFAELRRQWKAKGGGTSWEQWLAQYDFKKEFNKLTPSQRGERPQVFAPRMRSVS